jgi:hypothetical protein
MRLKEITGFARKFADLVDSAIHPSIVPRKVLLDQWQRIALKLKFASGTKMPDLVRLFL